MKFLVDMPLSPQLARWLGDEGHDAVHAGILGLHTAPDQVLIDLARRDGRILVTADLDFPRILALTYAAGPSVILFRGGNYSQNEMQDLMRRVLDRYGEAELTRSLVVVDRSRLRRTSLPL